VLGDTPGHIAKQYHSSVEEIEAANRLEEGFLTVGSVLLVPVSRETFESVLAQSRDKEK
jgi:LysM repeat protein